MESFQKNKQARLLVSIFGGAAFSFIAYFFYKKIFLKFKSRLSTIAEKFFLKKQEAFLRSSLIKNLTYTLYLNLTTRNPICKNNFLIQTVH